jgi:hypothetical protein
MQRRLRGAGRADDVRHVQQVVTVDEQGHAQL